jgi:alpha-tubulin suppressor-like RCC1 family protein
MWYYWGAEEGRGNSIGANQPTPEKVESTSRVIDVSAGSRHSFIVQIDGTATVAGFVESPGDYRGHLGLGPTQCASGGLCQGYVDPQLITQVVNANGQTVDAPNFVRAYAGVGVPSDTGQMHSMLISEEGKVYTTGNDSKGQLCQGNTPGYLNYFHEVPGINNAVAGAVGQEFTLILTQDGNVYGCGSNEVGQIGQGNGVGSRKNPTIIPGLGGIDDISAGVSFALFLDVDSNTAWGTGTNLHTQLCDFNEGSPYMEVEEIQLPNGQDIIQVQASRESSYFLLDNGNVWACGRNDEGQLGDGTFENSFSNGRQHVTILLDEDIRRIGSGPTAQSVFFIGTENVWAAGINDRNQLGTGGTSSMATPGIVDFYLNNGSVDVEFISASGTHSMAI